MNGGSLLERTSVSKHCRSVGGDDTAGNSYRYEWALALIMVLPSLGYYLNYCLLVFELPGIASQLCYALLILIALYSGGALFLKRADLAVCILLLVFTCCASSYFVFGNSRYLFGTDSLSIQALVLSNVGKFFILFLPPLFLFLLGVRIDESMRLAAPIAATIVVLQFIVFVLTNFTRRHLISEDYMSYAYYAFLPLLILGFTWSKYTAARILMVVGWGLVLVSGSRGAVVSAGIFLIAYLGLRIIGGRQSRKVGAGIAIAVIVISLFNIEMIASFAEQFLSGFGFNSRSLSSLLSGSAAFFSGSGREVIYSAAIDKISFTGLGLFGDRSVVGDINSLTFGGVSISTDAYVHNWILELLVDFGWFFGAVFVALVFWIYAKGLLAARRSSEPGVILIASFATSMIFGRFFISASPLGSSEFMLSLILLLWCVQLDSEGRLGEVDTRVSQGAPAALGIGAHRGRSERD